MCPSALQGCKANQAHTDTHPTKSERDSADLEGLVWGEGRCYNPSGSRPNFFGDSTSPLTRGGKNVVRSEGEASNPSVLTAERFGE